MAKQCLERVQWQTFGLIVVVGYCCSLDYDSAVKTTGTFGAAFLFLPTPFCCFYITLEKIILRV